MKKANFRGSLTELPVNAVSSVSTAVTSRKSPLKRNLGKDIDDKSKSMGLETVENDENQPNITTKRKDRPKVNLGPTTDDENLRTGISSGSRTKPKMTIPTESLNLPLHMTDDDYEEEDEEEEEQIFNILKKLKEAQSTANNSKKRKRNHEIIETCRSQFLQESKQLIAKYSRKWNSKETELMSRGEKLRDTIQSFQKRIRNEMNQYKELLDRKVYVLNDIQQKLQDIESSFMRVFRENELKMDYETRTMRTEIDQKLDEVRIHLARVYHQSTKDDKLTKLIKTFLTAL